VVAADRGRGDATALGTPAPRPPTEPAPGVAPARTRPRQAVIVAGGRGTRLGSLTADRPKPMVQVNGRPFLDHLIELLRDQGMARVLVLTGYRAEVIERHVAEGRRRFGIPVSTFPTDPALETSARMRAAAARGLLEDAFLFAYSDNFWPLRMDSLWRDHERLARAATVTVYRNVDGWSRSNTRVEDGLVTAYDTTRTADGLTGVEIGYAILGRAAVDLVDDVTRPFEQVVYPALVAAGQLAAHETDRRYYSIGSPDRLLTTARFLAQGPAVILDRDGVLNRRAARGEYVRSPADWAWLPGAVEALQLLSRAGWRLFVVSNQAGVAREAMTRENLEAVEERMLADLAGAGVSIDGIYYCLHGWDDGCACRKPRPGMLLRAAREHDLDLTRTPFVGDDERDGQAADAADAPFLRVDEHRSLLDVARHLLERSAT
jgi:histidinol-phosphate phosphatase family protein